MFNLFAHALNVTICASHRVSYTLFAEISYLRYYTIQGIGNGLPLGAVVTTPEIASVMAQKIQFNTFGGNPVCSAGGHAVLKVIDKEERQKHCAEVGSHLIGRLRDLQQTHDSNYLKLCRYIHSQGINLTQHQK